MPVVIVALCLHSLALPGYVLQVDSAFGPHAPFPPWGFTAPIGLITYLIGGGAAGRLWLGGALFLCGFGPMALFRRSHWLVQLFAGLLAMLNPFVYGRMVEGQWGVAASIGMIFLWVGIWEELQRRPSWALSIGSAALAAVAMMFDQHAIGLLLVLGVVSVLWGRAWRDPRRLGLSAASFLVLGLLIAFGLIPFFLGHGSDSYFAVERFSRADLVEFRAAASSTYGLWPNLAGLFGFWPERLGRIPLLNQGAPWWPIPTAILILAAALGAWLCRGRGWLLVTGLIGLGLAGSTATGPGLTVAEWLLQRVPLLAAYREPEKWSGLWLLALVVLGAECLTWLLGKVASGSPGVSAGFGLAAACIMVAVLLPNGVGALREFPATVVPVQYPAAWLGAAAYLHREVPSPDRIVVLPWELYQPLAFTGHRLTANPAPVLFEGNLLSPTDPQIPGAANQSGPDDLAQASLDPVSGSCQLASTLRRLGIHWVVVEPAPKGSADYRELVNCGYRLRYGRHPGLAVLSR